MEAMPDTNTTPAHGDYRLEFSRDQWVVSVWPDGSSKKSKGNPNWRQVSYHNRFPHAVKWLADKLVGHNLSGRFPRIFLESPAELYQNELDEFVEALAGVTRRFTMSKQQNEDVS